MTIYKSDGTPYEPVGSVRQFETNVSQLELFNQWDEESIQRGGSPIYYYEVMIQPQTVHPLYLEDRGKIYSKHPVKLWAAYEPGESMAELTRQGWDTPSDEVIFQVNYRTALQEIGRPPQVGSRIFTPHRGENWKIFRRGLKEFKMWGTLRLELHCVRFQEDRTIEDGKVTETVPDYRIV